MSRLQLTTAQKMDTTADQMAVQIRRLIENLNGLYRDFWGNDRAETIAALNENVPKSLADLQKHGVFCASVNAAAEGETLVPIRAIVGMPEWIVFDGSQFAAAPEPIEPQPE